MHFSGAKRLDPAVAGDFFATVIRPRLPAPIGMSNRGSNTILRDAMTDESSDFVSANARRLMILSFAAA